MLQQQLLGIRLFFFKEYNNTMFKQYITKQNKREKYYKGKISYYKRRIEKSDYIVEQSKASARIYFSLLKRIYNKSGCNWFLITNQFPHEDYIWWSFTNYESNARLRKFIDILEMDYKCDLGCPVNIIAIVELINMNTYFNRRIRYFFTLMSWAHNIFIYYNRFYRYLKNDKLFGKKQRLAIKHRHKLHFVAFISHRQYTGFKFNKNNLQF